MDRLSPERRSWNMSRIKSRDTAPEIRVRSLLHQMGYRFRINVHELPGTPDIVLKKYKTAVLIHGCFWHRHPGCPRAYTPKSRIAFWSEKFSKNVARDDIKNRALRRLGWRVIVLWECEIEERPDRVVRRLRSRLGAARPA